MHYDEHGNFTIVMKGSILHLDAHGPFNDEIGETYVKEMREIIIKHKPKAQISYLHNSILLSPSIEEGVKDLINYSVSHGLKYEAIIFDADCNEKNLFKIQIKRITGETTYHYNFFDSKEEGLHWINSLELI
jgi:hypothetical protein